MNDTDRHEGDPVERDAQKIEELAADLKHTRERELEVDTQIEKLEQEKAELEKREKADERGIEKEICEVEKEPKPPISPPHHHPVPGPTPAPRPPRPRVG